MSGDIDKLRTLYGRNVKAYKNGCYEVDNNGIKQILYKGRVYNLENNEFVEHEFGSAIIINSGDLLRQISNVVIQHPTKSGEIKLNEMVLSLRNSKKNYKWGTESKIINLNTGEVADCLSWCIWEDKLLIANPISGTFAIMNEELKILNEIMLGENSIGKIEIIEYVKDSDNITVAINAKIKAFNSTYKFINRQILSINKTTFEIKRMRFIDNGGY